jgi:Methyltransferase domain
MALGIKTYFRYQIDKRLGKYDPEFQGVYEDWRAKRIQAILDHYGHKFFEGKTVLELGAGYGDIGHFFSMLGAKVTCVEGREKNTQQILQRYPSLKAITHDLNQGLPSKQRYDVIIHFGVLYHLQTPERSLRESCQCSEHLILETECSDSDDPQFLPTAKETSYVYDQAIDGVGTRPSQAWVERILSEEKEQFERLFDGRLNAGDHTYDWPLKNTKKCPRGQRRFWFAKHA